MNVHNKNIANQYDIICDSFDNSRVRIWNNVKKFLLDSRDFNENLLDCGCGNGKNMIYAKTLGYNCVGFDISDNRHVPKHPSLGWVFLSLPRYPLKDYPD